jgi:quercetin dioxygenase-like cupin family protein
VSAHPRALPAFLDEIWDEVSLDERTTINELDRLLSPSAPPPSVASRLAREIETLPLRYAPFFDRLAAVWDLPVGGVQAVLERAKSPEAWRKTALPGLALLDVQGGERVRDADVHLVRFAPGMRFPRHRHPGNEALFVLEGSYRDSSGRVVVPGDLHAMSAGSEHGFVVARGEPCIAASVQRGREFTGWLIRFLSKFVP